MNNVFVYCEIEGTTVVDVSLELLSKGRKLANTLGVQLECICAGSSTPKGSSPTPPTRTHRSW